MILIQKSLMALSLALIVLNGQVDAQFGQPPGQIRERNLNSGMYSGVRGAQQPMRQQVVPEWKRDFFDPNRRSVDAKDRSFIYVEVPKAREIKEQDIISIIVDEKAEVTVNSQFNRQRNNTFKLDLKEFIRLNDRGNLVPAATNQPGIDSAVQERAQTNGQTKEAESIKYRIAATVANVYPNGNLVLIARKRIQTDDEVWSYELSGIISSKDVLQNRTASSENIAELHIRKRQMGKVYSTTKWRWGMKMMDMLSPF